MGNSSEIKVTFAALDTASADTVATAARIHNQLEDLKKFVAPMVATWDGDAAVQYGMKQQQWNAAAADLRDVLGLIGKALGTAADSYRQVEGVNVKRWA